MRKSSFLISKEVLSLIPRDFPKTNGMLWTMMIACHTSCTRVIMFPLRQETLAIVIASDISYRTHLSAHSAVDAHFTVNHELSVVYHVAVKVFTNNVGEKPWSSALRQIFALLASSDFRDNHSYSWLSLIEFGYLNILGVGIHKGKAYVCVGHLDRDAKMERHAP